MADTVPEARRLTRKGKCGKGKAARLDAIARLYDHKTVAAEMNRLLAEPTRLFFNHNGLLLPGQTLEDYRPRVTDERSLLAVLHEMEANLVRSSMQHLGSPRPGMLGLDAGCGAGGAALMIHESYGVRLEGVTISGEQVRYATDAAQARGADGAVTFVQDNMIGLDRPEEHYDFVWMCESTEHIAASDFEQAFTHFAKLCRPGGRLVITTWNSDDPDTQRRVDDHYLTCVHPLETYQRLIPRCGWEPVDCIDLTPQTAPYWKLRAESKHRTGSEGLMAPAFANGRIGYHVLVFRRESADTPKPN